ncbi:uncharacterized protein LY89DRAFT_120218 [Mollisia scopiformis]|uniref:Uncharacterized protein n=1 Tax=Mollisia scopiformis TaxID=149040 RepID=A0A194X3F3_MOLSC|nr:uncharacterized protein LY89DRAFT_120218 [Mollisia scopiformis]KUJ14723.1 hypothetical protein LY89DRAFT_120218 [Mollisia scopiformis]
MQAEEGKETGSVPWQDFVARKIPPDSLFPWPPNSNSHRYCPGVAVARPRCRTQLLLIVLSGTRPGPPVSSVPCSAPPGFAFTTWFFCCAAHQSFSRST